MMKQHIFAWGALPVAALLLASFAAGTAAEMSVFTVTAGDGRSKEFPCMPQISSPAAAFPQVLRNGDLEIQIVRLNSQECDSSSSSAASAKTAEDLLNSEDTKKVNGKVAVFEICSEAASREEYWLDYFRKAVHLEKAGAAMLIAAEAYIAKLPEHMDMEISVGPRRRQRLCFRKEAPRLKPCLCVLQTTIGVPVCVMQRSIFRGLETRANAAEGSLTGDFSTFEMYSPYNEPRLDSPITNIKITETANGQPLDVLLPAATATFNPMTSPERTAKLVPLELKEDCYKTQSEDWDACVRCWTSGGLGNTDGPVANFDDIAGTETVGNEKILFVSLLNDTHVKDHSSTCYNYFYHWGVFGAALLAEGVIIGGNKNDVVTVAGPNKVGSKTVPTFAVISMHTSALSQLLKEGDEAQKNVTVRIPELVDRQGPPFYAPADIEPGLTDIVVWDAINPSQAEESGVESRHFDCLAGQAIYNPQNHPGTGPLLFEVDGTVKEGSSERVVYVKPSNECASASSCLVCLKPETKKLALELPSYSDLIIVLNEADFPCFHKHSEFSLAAEEASPFALLVGQIGASRHTIMDSTISEMDFPTYTIDATCGERIVGLCKDDTGVQSCPEGLYVQLPPIVNGIAREYSTYSTEDEMPEAAITFTSPADLAQMGPLLVGQTNFNPQVSPPMKDKEVIVAETQDACNSEESCLECDLMPWRWTRPKQDFAGRVAMFSLYKINDDQVYLAEQDDTLIFNFRGFNRQATCLLPWSNIMKDMEDAGAVAVLFMDGDDTIRTLIQQGVPHDISIPSFNIPVSLGQVILANEFVSEYVSEELTEKLQMNVQVKVDLPRIAGGVAVSKEDKEIAPDSQYDSFTDLPDAEELVESGFAVPPWAIGVAIAGGILFICGCAGMYHLFRRKRRMFAYNQMDCAVQADALLDIMSAPPGDDEGFTDEPLYNNSESSPAIAAAPTLSGRPGAMQMVDMSPKKNHHDMGVGP